MIKRIHIAIFLTVLFFSCAKEEKERNDPHAGHDMNHEHMKDSTSEITYWCPMDTHIVQKKPGTCPLCGMDLEPKPGAHAHTSIGQEDWVYTPANVSVISGIKSIKPLYKSVPVKIKVSGYIAYDERRINAISAKTGGRVEKLYVKYNFQPVKKGQALFKVFSHELQTAQQEYLFIKRNDPNAAELISAAKRKLLLLGMTKDQIEKINASEHIHATTTVYSPYTGFVIDKQEQSEVFTPGEPMKADGAMSITPNMSESNKEMTLREGAYVNTGETIFKVVNTETVWGIFEVYAGQLKLIKKNQPIHMVLENTNEMIMGKVDFIEPAYKEGTGTSRIRVYLDNKDQHLKIGNLISGEIEAGEKSALWVPQSAVYDLGISKIVFVKRDGAFETRKVTVGYISGKEIEITGGISQEEEIAENAQFMIDSESFIKIKKSFKE